MRIIQVNAIEGPNYFHHKPVIRGIVMIPKEKGKPLIKSMVLMKDCCKQFQP